jgi:hypothetical protein
LEPLKMIGEVLANLPGQNQIRLVFVEKPLSPSYRFYPHPRPPRQGRTIWFLDGNRIVTGQLFPLVNYELYVFDHQVR